MQATDIVKALGMTPGQFGPDKMTKINKIVEGLAGSTPDVMIKTIIDELGIVLDPKKHKDDEPKMKKTGRNEQCPCGSSKKYKKCCIVI
jgi:hypothetical protein